jgi:hypothetical protein
LVSGCITLLLIELLAMKRLFFIFCITLLPVSHLFSQDLKDAGAGVIDFLLRNPKTADRMKPSESIALDIIGNLLKTSSQRNHELNLAAAGSDKVIINSNDNRQAEIVRDTNGKIYLLVDGIIYPISDELVKQAQINPNISTTSSIVSIETLYPYNLETLVKADRNIIKNDEICTVFTCNNIIIHNGLYSIKKHFQNIKRSFYNSEDIYFVVRYNTSKKKEYYCNLLTLRLYDENNNLRAEQSVGTKPNESSFQWWPSLHNFSPGIYTIHVILGNNSNEFIPIGLKHKVEKIEILNR